MSAPRDPEDDGQPPEAVPMADEPEDASRWEPDYEPLVPAVNWQNLLVKNSGGKLKSDSLQNAILLVENQYKGIFVLNEFSDEIFVIRCPPWEDPAKFKAHRLTQDDIIRMTACLECRGLAPTTKKTADAISTVAKKNAFHPVRKYFDSLKWDGISRLSKWISYYLGSEQNLDYLAAVGTKWLVAAVTRIYRPGAKFDHMLVLEGKQNKGKSTALRTLATFGRDEPVEYFCDSVTLDEIGEPSATAMFQGKIIIEFQELEGMKKKEDTALKRYITLQTDEVQKKYENPVTAYPRQFVLAGTTNDDCWLRDPTGNRRYWPVKVGEIDIAALKNDREQLWAEAVALYKADYKIWLADGDPVYKLAQAEQSQRVAADPWEPHVLKFIAGRPFVTIAEILKDLMPLVASHDNAASSRVAGILKNNGWESNQETIEGVRARYWKKTP